MSIERSLSFIFCCRALTFKVNAYATGNFKQFLSIKKGSIKKSWNTRKNQFLLKTLKRPFREHSRMKIKNRPHTQDIKRRFSAPFPHHLRTFSAGSPLIVAEKVWKRCWDGAVKGVSIY